MSLFGDYVKELRSKRGMSQRELAERVGLDFTYISKIENGKLPPPSEGKLLSMEKALGVEKYELILFAEKIPTDFKNVILADADVQDYLKERVKVWDKMKGVKINEIL